MAEYTIKHPELGVSFKGVATSENVVQFRGIKFASIPKRFARSELVTGYDGPEVDCTKIGPNAPTMFSLVPYMDHLLQKMFFAVPDAQLSRFQPEYDEFECLNLTITLPKSLLSGSDDATTNKSTALPVFAHFPGGANMIASHGDRTADMTNLVEASVRLGKPIVAVHIPYRVGFLGFGVLPGGIGGNNGLFDQRNGLHWIRAHIGAFGGDAANVTIAGESAGSFAVDSHLQARNTSCTPSTLQLFRRGMMLSGHVQTLPPRPVAAAIALAQKAAASIGIEGDAWAEKFAALPTDALLDAQLRSGLALMCAVDDGEFFEMGYRPGETVVPEWVESVVVGDCAVEEAIWAQSFTNVNPEEYVKQHAEILAKLDPGYKTTGVDPQLAVARLMNFLGDAAISYPAHYTARAYRAAGKRTYRYVFDQANPWSAARGAHHACDLLYWFSPFALPDAHTRRVSDEMQKRLVSYVYGEEPWDARKVLAFGPEGKVEELDEVAGLAERRRVGAFEFLAGMRQEEVVAVLDSVLDSLAPAI